MRKNTLALIILLTGCAEPPVLPDPVVAADRNAAYPVLVPLGPILAAAAEPGNADPAAGIDARVAALNARAGALRGPVIDAATATALQ